MAAELTSDALFESARLALADKSSDELASIIAEQFDDAYPPDGLYAGTLRDRVWQFVLNNVRTICAGASGIGKDVWEALHDEHTAHNTERFALVCSFFATYIFPGGHWPIHELAAFVLLVLTIQPKAGGQA